MPLKRSLPACLISSALALVCVAAVVLIAVFGAFFNRGRGGYVHFNPTGSNTTAIYWTVHISNRLFFAIPTGIMVLILGLHVRAGMVVMVMTWASLYAGWGCYMSIGTNTNDYLSRSGFADWMIGRQEVNWTGEMRYVREYTGMSLRGLLWTAPQGYVLEQLGFGWEFSLCGSLMGSVYYLAALSNLSHPHDKHQKHPNHPFVDSNIAVAEVLWGWLIWYVLIICCFSQVEYRIKLWIHKNNPYLGVDPHSTYNTIFYKSLNRCGFRLIYDVFMIFLTIIFCCSLTYYSLVEQKDLANKGQTFFGLCTAILCLVFSLGWQLGSAYLRWNLKREAKLQKHLLLQTPQIQRRNIHQPRTSPLLRNQQEIYRRSRAHTATEFDSPSPQNVSPRSPHSETEPLLHWPYSHPDRLSPPQSLQLPESDQPDHMHVQYNTFNYNRHQPGSISTGFLILWPNLENWIFLDIFIWIRRCIGFLSLLCIVHNIVVAVIAVVWGWNSPRFLH